MMFLSIMMKRGDARFYQMDFPGAYLKGDLPTEIYLRMNKATVDILKKSHPEVIPDIRADGTLISRIQKALYGLKESGKIFRDLSVEVLKEFGLIQLDSHPCIFKKILPDGKYIDACMYVDDLLLVSNDELEVASCVSHCEKVFPGIELIHTYMQPPISFLGMSILFDYKNKIIRYNTTMYIEELCAKYEVEIGSKMLFTQGLMKSDQNDELMQDPLEYESLVMALFYVAKKCRPDILFPVAYLATESESPTQEILDKAFLVLYMRPRTWN